LIPHERTASRTSSAPWWTTITIRDGRTAATFLSDHHSAGRPQIGCRTFGVPERRRLPLPAARTTAASDDPARDDVGNSVLS
jgi:hypothetical protein